MKHIALLVGSLRKDSSSRKLAQHLQALAPQDMEMTIVEIGNLPLYNEDLEHEAPQAWTDFREQLASCEGVIFITPEYNRSYPGGLKNAIDVGSRPYGASIRDKKIMWVMSSSPSSSGGFGANQDLRKIAPILNMYTMPQPEAFYHNVQNFFTDQNELTEEGHSHLSNFIESYSKWIEKMSS